MNGDLIYYLNNSSGSLSIQEIILNFIAAIIIGFIIFLSYRFSHSGAVYSAKFNVSLWMMTLVTTLVMCVIGNNIALSLGMVGALSIVRFRTAIKDPRDTAYIFWTIAAGVCCGISDFMIAGIGSAVIFCLMLIIGNVNNNERYLVIIRGDFADGTSVEEIMNDHYKEKAKLRVKNSSRQDVEYIYEVSTKLLKDNGGSKAISEKLYQIETVNNVNIVCQNDEISA